jgi:glycosyl transferase family 87
MPEHFTKRAGAVPILILLMLVSLAAPQLIGRFSEAIGVDFYNFWGVPVALRLTDHTLGSPYTNGQRYHAVLKDYAATANQPKLRSASRFWGGPDYTGSPLLYWVFTLVSSDYTFSLGVFQTLQILSFLGACLLVGSLHRWNPFSLLCLALLCLLIYQPLLSDLRVGNLGCWQLVVLAGVMGLASALPRVSSFGPRAGLGALLLVVLVALTLCKPNIALIGALLAVHLGARYGARVFGVAALAAAVATALLLLVPCLYFGSFTVWQEWYRFVYGSNPAMLVRPVANGNYATALLLASWLGVSVATVAGVLLVLLGLSLAVVIFWRNESLAPAPRTAREALRAGLTRVFDDHRPPLAIGILVTAAASPLYWVHYYVLLLIPSLWLLTSAASRFAPTLAATGVLMSGGMVGMLLWACGWPGAMPASIALSWVPLWGALLISLRSSDATAPRTATLAGDSRSTIGHAARAPRPRRRKK